MEVAQVKTHQKFVFTILLILLFYSSFSIIFTLSETGIDVIFRSAFSIVLGYLFNKSLYKKSEDDLILKNLYIKIVGSIGIYCLTVLIVSNSLDRFVPENVMYLSIHRDFFIGSLTYLIAEK